MAALLVTISRHKKNQSGFTLVELIMVVVLLGILSVATTQFIQFGVGSYVDTARRDDLQQQARFVSERISRELRNALPGSVRVNSDGSCLEFIPIDAAGSYLGRVSDAAITEFQVVDFSVPDSLGQVAIYTLDPFDVYDRANNAVAAISAISDPAVSDQRTITLSAPHRFANESPTSRFFLTSTRVSFCAVDGALTRYSGYSTVGEANPQLQVIPNPAAHGGRESLTAEHIRLVEDGVSVAVFSFSGATLQRSALVHMDLRFRNNTAQNEWLRFSQDVFLRNTP